MKDTVIDYGIDHKKNWSSDEELQFFLSFKYKLKIALSGVHFFLQNFDSFVFEVFIISVKTVNDSLWSDFYNAVGSGLHELMIVSSH